MPAASSPPEIGKLQQLKADARMVRERLATMDPSSFATVADLAEFLKIELTQNVVPMFESTVDAVLDDVGTEVDRLGDEFEQYIQENGDQLSEEAARGVIGVFQQGLVIAKMLEDALPKLDDLKKKKAKEAIRVYRGVELAMREFVESIVVEEEEAETGEGEADPAPDAPEQADDDDDDAGDAGDEDVPVAPGGEG